MEEAKQAGEPLDNLQTAAKFIHNLTQAANRCCHKGYPEIMSYLSSRPMFYCSHGFTNLYMGNMINLGKAKVQELENLKRVQKICLMLLLLHTPLVGALKRLNSSTTSTTSGVLPCSVLCHGIFSLPCANVIRKMQVYFLGTALKIHLVNGNTILVLVLSKAVTTPTTFFSTSEASLSFKKKWWHADVLL